MGSAACTNAIHGEEAADCGAATAPAEGWTCTCTHAAAAYATLLSPKLLVVFLLPDTYASPHVGVTYGCSPRPRATLPAGMVSCTLIRVLRNRTCTSRAMNTYVAGRLLLIVRTCSLEAERPGR